MTAPRSENEAIFHAARDIPDQGRRQGYVREACGGDEVRIALIEALLAAADSPDSLLDHPAIPHGDDATQAVPPAWDADESLDFLTPSDKPDVLGRLGHYEILEVIGRGGMGIVLRAFDEQLHRVVAIKVIAAQLATNVAARRRFTREAQAQAAVSHDHVVTIHAVQGDSPRPYLVMQYVAGLSLQQRLDRDGHLTLHEILRVGMQSAAGLSAAHAQGLIHRDIKPANILLENGVERVKITDFGLARVADEASMTHSGVVAGTPHYMSPEQAEGKALDQRTDLFSLGSVLYAMSTGRAPFRASGTMAVLKRVCEDMPTQIRETNPEVPDWLVAIINKLHAKDPAERFQSAAEVAELLGRHLAHVQHPSVVGPVSNSPVRSKADAKSMPRRHKWAVAAAILLVCLLGTASLTEATGVTQLHTSVIRIFTPQGTLIVEVDDPGVKVTIEGDGGLVITGAGPQEVRLKPGRYKLQAVKDGKAVRLDHDLVTISRGGKLVVRVSLDRARIERGAGPSIEDDIRKLTERIEKAPADQRARIERAHLYVRQRRWRDGADDLSAAGEATLQEPGDAFLYAILLVQIREFDLHRRLCEQMLERFAKTSDVWTANCLLKSCLLRPGAVDPARLPLALLSEDREFATKEPQWLLREARAFHAYRSGRLEEARRLVRETLSVPAYKNDPLYAPRALSILAMASYKSGDRRLALDLYQQARQQFDKIQLPAGHAGASSWLLTDIIRREAAQELGLDEASAPGELQAFIVFIGNGIEIRKFDTLAEAVQHASDGDTIEIRGNGPFVSRPIGIRGGGLTIRAGTGFRPVIEFSPDPQKEKVASLSTNFALVLEGLEVDQKGTPTPLVQAEGTSLRAVNCRLRSTVRAWSALNVFRNCEFYGDLTGVTGHFRPESHIVFENCVFRTGGVPLYIHEDLQGLQDTSVQIQRCTFASPRAAIWLAVLTHLDVPENPSHSPQPIHLEVRESAFDVRLVLGFDKFRDLPSQEVLLGPTEAEAALLRLVKWRGEQNVFTAGSTSVWWCLEKDQPPVSKPLDEWKQFWGGSEINSMQGAIRFQGGNPLSRTGADVAQLKAEEFRLRPDSAGYQAGNDGKDLGADVDLVGPGSAYERWKETPEYQQWIEETGSAAIDVYVRQANESVKLGRLDAAAEEFSKALNLIKDPSAHAPERQRIVTHVLFSDDLFRRVLELRPQDLSLRSACAHCLAEQGRWQEATACFRARLELGPDGAGFWSCYATASLAANDLDGYRRVCEEMLETFSNIPDPQEAWWASWTMALAPHSVKDEQKAFRLAEKARNGLPNAFYGARSYAAWLYRLGRLEESVACWDRDGKEEYEEIRTCFRAMAHHRLGHADEAVKYRDQARSAASSKLTPWYRRVYYEQLMQETEAVLAAAPDVTATPESEVAKNELAKWQGEWENADYGRLVIRGERWSSYPKDGFEVVSTIKIVEVASEMTHLLLLSAGVDGKVRTIQTILRVDGETLHNCGTIGSVRPTEFATKPGFIYTQWKRVAGPPP